MLQDHLSACQVTWGHESGRSDDSYWDKARRITLWWLGSFPSHRHQSTRIQAVLATIKATEQLYISEPNG